MAHISLDFDVFAGKTLQRGVVDTTETHVRSVNSVEQSDLEFIVPPCEDRYTDANLRLYVRGKFVMEDGTDLHVTDHSAPCSNFLHSLFIQCSIYLNGVPITRSRENYSYRAYFENVLSYGTNAESSHLTNECFYKDVGDLLAGDPATCINKGIYNPLGEVQGK